MKMNEWNWNCVINFHDEKTSLKSSFYISVSISLLSWLLKIFLFVFNEIVKRNLIKKKPNVFL